MLCYRQDGQKGNTIKKQELFDKTIKAMDNYTRAVEMDYDDFANYFDSRMKELLKEIKKRGWHKEFKDFACIV